MARYLNVSYICLLTRQIMVQWYELKNREAIEQYEQGGGEVRMYQRSTQFDSIPTETILHGYVFHACSWSNSFAKCASVDLKVRYDSAANHWVVDRTRHVIQQIKSLEGY